MLLKAAVVGLTIILGSTWYFNNKNSAKYAPPVDEVWWRPGNEKTVDKSIRKFSVSIPGKMIEDLQDRLRNTKYSAEPLKGTAWTYGMSSKSLRKVVDYWLNNYDFKKREAFMNQYPQFVTNIQGLDIHFVHVKPENPEGKRVIPLLMQHGWPGSVLEFYKIIPMLTTPRPEYDFVFEVVAPSLPGFGFSDAATIPGLSPAHIAIVMKNLMLRLGFDKFYTQGGDWGAVVTSFMGATFPENVLGVHLNMCASYSTWSMLKMFLYSFAPSLILPPEDYHRMYPLKKHFTELLKETGYFHLQATKPDTIGAALSDSPAGLAAYILEKFSTGTNRDYRNREDGGLLEKWTMDELLDNLMFYWIPNSIGTSVRIYAEFSSKQNQESGADKKVVDVPSACAQFPHELAYQPAAILRDRYRNLIRVTNMEKGGHFAAMEEPKLLADDIWPSISEMEALRKAPSQKK